MKFNSFREVDYTGVIFVMTEAAKAGYSPSDTSWTNLGQGQPETGPLGDDDMRPASLTIDPDDQEYAPVNGLIELRQAVADYYNRLYRRGKQPYTHEHVCIAPGGRAALTRIAASLDNINLGHFIPDYTAYQELLTNFRIFSPIPILLDQNNKYSFTVEQLDREIMGRGLGAALISNPCNPTGKLVDDLGGWVRKAKELDCALIFDEFYSHFVWNSDKPSSISAAEHVNNVDSDPIIIVNGLTKNWRLPGWRVAWIVGPKPIMASLASAGSFLDGGASRPLQRAAIEVLKDETLQEKRFAALHKHFSVKRDYLLNELRELGVGVNVEPQGTFYVWGDLRALPESINTGMSFFRKALDYKVICVPGEFFDVDPGGRRANRPSRFRHHMRFSFGASMSQLETGIRQLKRMISEL